MFNLEITSDGTAEGTTVSDAKTKKPVGVVSSFTRRGGPGAVELISLVVDVDAVPEGDAAPGKSAKAKR